MGVLYLINAVGTPRYKIGFTTTTALKRLQNLQTGCPFDLELVAERDGSKETERKLHDKLCKFHHRGEWFNFSDHESALHHFEMRKAKPPRVRTSELRPHLPPVQKMANQIMGQCFRLMGATPRIIGKKRWEAQEGSAFYKIAQVAVVKKLKPNPSGINALLMCNEEYWKNLDKYPPLFFDAEIGPELTEEQYAEIDNAR